MPITSHKTTKQVKITTQKPVTHNTWVNPGRRVVMFVGDPKTLVDSFHSHNRRLKDSHTVIWHDDVSFSRDLDRVKKQKQLKKFSCLSLDLRLFFNPRNTTCRCSFKRPFMSLLLIYLLICLMFYDKIAVDVK